MTCKQLGGSGLVLFLNSLMRKKGGKPTMGNLNFDMFRLEVMKNIVVSQLPLKASLFWVVFYLKTENISLLSNNHVFFIGITVPIKYLPESFKTLHLLLIYSGGSILKLSCKYVTATYYWHTCEKEHNLRYKLQTRLQEKQFNIEWQV